MTLFVAAPIAGPEIETIAKNLVYFFAVEATVLISIVLVPDPALRLPRALGYQSNGGRREDRPGTARQWNRTFDLATVSRESVPFERE
jgi:hypothetical protein